MKSIFLSLSFICLVLTVNSQQFEFLKSGTFKPQNKKVLLLKDKNSDRKLIFFESALRVNTDGSPVSYHPFDPWGQNLAINTILNAIAIYRKGDSSNKNLSIDKTTSKEAMSVFIKFRDSNYEKIPDGYRLKWDNVLIPSEKDIKKPCIFLTGPYKGYFSSATSLKNALETNKGECECNNQVNGIEVPGLVLAANSIVRDYGANTGDLVVAYNSKNGNLVYGIINDSGPANNLGEGSIKLNMKLLGKTTVPKNIKETYTYSTGIVKIAIIPNSKLYNRLLPYTDENITTRVEKWLSEAGFSSQAQLKSLLSKKF